MKINIERVRQAIVNFDQRYLNQEIEDFLVLDLPIDIFDILYSRVDITGAILNHTELQLYIVTAIIDKEEVPQLLIEYAKGNSLNDGLQKVMKPNNMISFWNSLLILNGLEDITNKNLSLIRLNNLNANILWLHSTKENYFIFLKSHSNDPEIIILKGFPELNEELKKHSEIIGIIN